MNNLENYLTAEEKAIVKQAQEIMDKAMCKALSDELDVKIEYIDEHTISVDGVEMDEDEFAQYLARNNISTEA